MGKFTDLTGQRFGRLTVVGRAENSRGGDVRWNCVCDCGNATVVQGTKLRKGRTRSCGCLNKERVSEAHKKVNLYGIEGTTVYVKLFNSEREMVADLDIWESAMMYCWYLSATGYACAKDPESGKQMKFHIFACPNCPDGMVRDHINGNKLDNRRSNIRFIPQQKNAQNRTKGKNNTSGHTGVLWRKRDKKWVAYITIGRKKIHLGYFSDIQDAIAAREAAEVKYFGEYRRKN